MKHHYTALLQKTRNDEALIEPHYRLNLSLLTSAPTYNDMKLFYTGPLVNAELLVVMLEKHGIAASQKPVDSSASGDNDLDTPTEVFVPEEDYERAWQLFYAEREDEL